MAIAAPTLEPQPQQAEQPPRWGMESAHVQRALSWIRKQGKVTTEELVEWDRAHGRRLFTWDDAEAARIGRIEEARG